MQPKCRLEACLQASQFSFRICSQVFCNHLRPSRARLPDGHHWRFLDCLYRGGLQPVRQPFVEHIRVPVNTVSQLYRGGQNAFVYPVLDRPDRNAEVVCDCLLGKRNECCVLMVHDGTKVVTVQGIATEVDGIAQFRARKRFFCFRAISACRVSGKLVAIGGGLTLRSASRNRAKQSATICFIMAHL